MKFYSLSYRCKFLDRASDLLPPSEHQKLYRQPTEETHGTEVNNSQYSALPTCKTPLSLLCVATKGKGLHVYLHGRYRIITLPMMAQRNVNVVCSPDLSHLLVHQEKSMNLSLFSIPSFSKQRHNLQIISALYCSMTSHMEAIQMHVPEILASWRVSIKPLDTKMEALVRLLKDYGVEPDLRTVLRHYILVGNTTSSQDIGSAIEQFFTGVQMNDQLVTRMERSLQAAIANVETTARSFLLGPARALAFHAGELLGLARFAPSLLSPEAAQRTLDLCGVLLTTAEYTLTKIVEARFRLQDFIAWLRAKGSEIKAKGTALNSAQSDNAKKRRVSQATVDKMLMYLRSESYQSNSVVERLLGIPLTVSHLPIFVR
jgi:Anaphase-promoting complex, cyclosome, subunit 4